MPKMPAGRVALAVALIVSVLPAVRWGLPLKRQFDANQACCHLPFIRNIGLSARQLTGAVQFFSEVGQDLWLTETVYPGKTQGFFLDVGSGHGTIGSNTKLLELKGWTGICIDPFPKHMEGRTCTMLKEVVFSKAGEKVQFKAAGDLGGIAGTLNAWKDKANEAETVEFTTTTLGEILDREKAPPVIDFMSLDIEGAELDALKGFPFDKYTIGALAVEHNYEEPKRTDIQKLLKAHGIERVGSIKQDDLYVRLAGK
jgi:FkbM family methyltransferase